MPTLLVRLCVCLCVNNRVKDVAAFVCVACVRLCVARCKQCQVCLVCVTMLLPVVSSELVQKWLRPRRPQVCVWGCLSTVCVCEAACGPRSCGLTLTFVVRDMRELHLDLSRVMRVYGCAVIAEQMRRRILFGAACVCCAKSDRAKLCARDRSVCVDCLAKVWIDNFSLASTISVLAWRDASAKLGLAKSCLSEKSVWLSVCVPCIALR